MFAQWQKIINYYLTIFFVQRQEHQSKKPDEKSDDPEDAALYRQAEENMGDYKLKTSADYVVPEDQRVTTEKKRKELLLHRQTVCTATRVMMISELQ